MTQVAPLRWNVRICVRNSARFGGDGIVVVVGHWHGWPAVEFRSHWPEGPRQHCKGTGWEFHFPFNKNM